MSAAAWRRAALALALVAASAAAQAGRSCEQKTPRADDVQRSMALAEHTAQALERSGAQVVALARIGQNLSEYGVRYSHFGLAYRDEQNGRPVWRVVHKLNHCGTAHAAIYRQGLGEFFLDDLFEYEAAVVVPTPAIQARLLPVLRDNARVAQLNTPAYSMVAYPWARTYQQSNQWALETLAMAQETTPGRPLTYSRAEAQSWLQAQGYTPTTLRIGPMKRLGGRLTAANIAFDDHPPEKRFTDRIETVTVDSVFAWLNRTGMGAAPQVIR